MTIEKWTKVNYNGTVDEAYIKGDGIGYTVCSTVVSLFNTYKTYTWARKSLEKYGFELQSTKIILGA